MIDSYNNIKLQGSDATEENAKNFAASFNFSNTEIKPQNIRQIIYSKYIDTVNSVDVYYNFQSNYYFFCPANLEKKTMYVSYYMRNIKPEINSKNNWAIALAFNADEWVARSLEHKGMSYHNYVCTRPMTQKEISVNKFGINKFRLCFCKYFHWDLFIDDEIETLGLENPFIKKLKDLRAKYPVIPNSKKPNQIGLF